LNFPEVVDLNIAGTNLSSESIVDLLTANRKLTQLDISDNDLTDDGIVTLSNHFINSAGQCTITSLKMNRVFNRKTGERTNAMKLLSKAISTLKVEEFELQGERRSGIKGDLIELVFGLLTNKTLTKLDISGHQAGDDLGLKLGNILQHNHTLSSLMWDNNDMGIFGFKAIKLGLERNATLQHLEIPFDDIFALKGKQDVNPDMLSALMKDIQKVITMNQKQKLAPTEEDKSSKSRAGKKVSRTKSKKTPKKPVTLDVDFRRASVAFFNSVPRVPTAETENPPPPSDVIPEPSDGNK